MCYRTAGILFNGSLTVGTEGGEKKLVVQTPSLIAFAAAKLEDWLESMRGPVGYGGPVAHWWAQSLVYTGPGLDWRYEGIIMGYLHLWERTRELLWLDKARRAGDDLVQSQLEDGHFPASSFELNPASAGTPHEAACDVGLLLLAKTLKQEGDTDWERYAACAEHNLQDFYLGQLWDPETRSFWDIPGVPSFVPNKAATACEAMFLLAEVRDDEFWVEQYALPNLELILNHQVRDGGRLDGALAQNSLRDRRVEKYFPLYMARCVPVLVWGYEWTKVERYLDCALRVMKMIARWAYPDGSLPTVIYPNMKVNRYPSWVASLADVLGSADLLRLYGFEANLTASHERLLAGQDESGGFQTATGFAAQAGGKPPELPDARDLLHVAGWCDKVFRYLAARVKPGPLVYAQAGIFEADCIFRGKVMRFREEPEVLEIYDKNEVRYRWVKGETWPQVAAPEFWLR